MIKPVTLEGLAKRIYAPEPNALETCGFSQERNRTENKCRWHLRSGCKTLTPDADLRHQVKSHGLYGEIIS